MKYAIAITAGALALAVAGTASAASDDLAVGQTSVNGSVFLDASHIDESVQGASESARSDGIDLKRFYFNVEHRFSEVWSVRVNTDIHWQRHQDPTDLWFKYAYLQGRFSKALTLRFGAAPMPWSPLVNHWYGYRYVDPELVSRVKVGETADWGVHSLGSFGTDEQWQYAVSVVTGAGYKKPRLGNGPDVAARVSWHPSAHTILAIGGYQGTRAQDVDSLQALHTARRLSVMAAYADSRWRAGIQYFRTRDWSQVLKPASDRGHGWSAWASVQLSPVVALFARHDRFQSSAWLDPQRRDRYSNVGVEWRARKWLRLAAVYKHESLVDSRQRSTTANEVGVWAQLTY